MGQIDLSAAGTAGDPGRARPPGKALGRAAAFLNPAVQPTSTHPHLGITEMILAKSKRWAGVLFAVSPSTPPPVLEPMLPSSPWTIF